MRRNVKLFTAAVFFTIFLSATQVLADTLVITSGSISQSTSYSSVLRTPFVFQGQNFQIQGLSGTPARSTADVAPGATISLSSVLSDFPGGPFTLPVDGTPNLVITDSFQLSGVGQATLNLFLGQMIIRSRPWKWR